ncbi:Glycosyltransferase involved in cell wall bisynthesis [Spirosomataceae bacterium TFI 002]|nr:Glycosyltransferase involved in cell wall bisynthesis [Spirosomataceae bacterium TFI 002]
MKYLIVDLNIELNGHKFGFVNELMKWIEKNGKALDEYHFLVNLNDEQFHKSKSANVFVVVPNSQQINDWEGANPLKKYQLQWAYILKASLALKVDRLVLMELDIYQAEIGKTRKGRFEIHGIWFRPFVRQKCLDESRNAKIMFSLNHFKKRRLFGWAMRNSTLTKVFVLNDQYTVDTLNRSKKNGNRLAYLPDPVFDINAKEGIDIREKYKIPNDRFVILIFGCIDDRKNVVNTLTSLVNLDVKDQEMVTLLIVGKIMDSYRDEMDAKITEVEGERKFGLVVNNEFVSEAEMDALFQQTDLVLRMNINYFASSGIIGMSAKYEKPSIVSNYGIVADITEKYKLGKLVDPLNTDQISEAIKYYFDNREIKEESHGQKYYQEHNADAFARTLLSF